MSINFEAANMAGYNNPKIEVFKATIDSATNKVIDAPSKTEIIRCLHRGSIPAILSTSPDGSETTLHWMYGVVTDQEGDTIVFGSGSYQILYPTHSEIPIVGA